MDGTPDWTANALFSPSKARVQQAQAKDWASVDAWLAKKYASKRVPTIERNEETLQALLTLATLNESADEQRLHVDRLEKTALQALSKGAPKDELSRLLSSELQGNDYLNALAETTVLLNSPEATPSAIAALGVDLTADKFAADSQLRQVETQLEVMQSEQRRMEDLLAELKNPALEAPPDIASQTSDWVRNTKQLKAKIAEYDERLNAASPTRQSAAPIEEVIHQIKESEGQRQQLGRLQTELRAYQSLPSNRQKALATLEKSKEDLRALVKQRDRCFEEMAES